MRVVGCADVLTSKIARVETVVGEKAVTYQITASSNAVYRRNRPDKAESKWIMDFVMPEIGGAESSGTTVYRHMGIESISTSVGPFDDCAKIEIKSPERTVLAWYAPGVGLVRRTNQGSGVTEILTRFKKG